MGSMHPALPSLVDKGTTGDGHEVKRKPYVEVGVGDEWFWASTITWRFVPVISYVS